MTDLHKFTHGAEHRGGLNVALISTEEKWLAMAANLLAVRQGVRCHEVTHLGANPKEFASALASRFDAVLLDVDSNPEYIFHLAEALCAVDVIYVMAGSRQPDMKQTVRFMRVGVREFFSLPVDPAEVAAALNRAAEYRPPVHTPAKPSGKLLVFLGAKGGVGVTTLAANFALALAQESEKKTLVIDLGVPLGDLAINLGMQTQYSVLNALVDFHRLDGNFIKTLVSMHSSGLAVLGAQSDFSDERPTPEALDKLLEVARQSYEYVVVDAGSRMDLRDTSLFEQSTTIYLITQVGITELRNANRIITQFFATRGRSLQVVLNRYTQRALLFDDAQITKTLTRPADWKIPDDWAAARRTRDTATPIAMRDSSLATSIREMMRAAAEIQPDIEKKRLFRLLH